MTDETDMAPMIQYYIERERFRGFVLVEKIKVKGHQEMEIQEGHYYCTRGGQTIGPIERTPAPEHPDHFGGSAKAPIWVWRAKDPDDKTGWLHWKSDGRWYQTPGHESNMDLVSEATDTPWTVSFLINAREQLDAADSAQRTEALAPQMTKHRLLDLAKEATADRGLNYGKPEDNFARIARRWNVFLVNRGYITTESAAGMSFGGPITTSDVAMMCADLKMARLENTPGHQDSWVDLAGYAACGAEIALAPKGESDGK